MKNAIKCEQHMVDSLNYITNPQKAEFVTYVTTTEVVEDMHDASYIDRDYRITRKLFNKNDSILAHHLVQSFSPEDNITPEEAHKIGLELIEKNLSMYQVTLATHIDGNEIHNHFIINSVSPLDGKKFLGQGKTIKSLRKSSDEICLNHNLSIIEKGSESKYKGLDNETLQCAKKGKSWKVDLVKDLDTAFEQCKNKSEFIEFFHNKNYEIKFQNKNITFKKLGFDKGIRADTLAKQFGMKYCKASIEKRLGIQSEINTTKEKTEKPKIPKEKFSRIYFNKIEATQWSRYGKIQQKKFKGRSYGRFNRVLFAKSPLDFTLRLICYIFLNTKHKNVIRTKIQKPASQRYRIKSYNDYKNLKQIVSNIPYKTLINTSGTTAQIKLFSWQIAKLLDNNILCSSKIDLMTGTALVIIKSCDFERVAEILNVPETQLIEQSKTINNKRVKYKIQQSKSETEYLVIDSKMLDKLSVFSLDYQQYIRADGRFTIAFSSADKDKILKVLFPNRQEKNQDSFYYRNVKINKELKAKAETTGQKVCYKIVVNSQYAKLKNSDIEFAVFKQNDGRYNIVYLEKDKQKLLNTIGGNSKNKNNNNKPIIKK